jgi:LuxR family transcriptional regulator, maltose regulon positive regulatory protein
VTPSSLLTLLVPTKLTAPQPRAVWVRRERLLAQLGAEPATRLTLVIAPAGFGKSTLVAQWLVEAQSAAGTSPGELPPPAALAWLTLDEHDQDGLRFVAYVAGAIEQVAPRALTTTRPLLNVPDPPSLYMVLQALLIDLSALPSGLILVLDDYHVITAEPIHQAVIYLLRHLPRACRMVIISRVDPPLPLVRLRAEQQLTEVRGADLRFTDAEAGALLANLFGRTPDEDMVANLHEETEGWALALQLAALARLEAPGPERTSNMAMRQIAEYLADEVFDRQAAPIQAALLALAVPERVCTGLAAALLDPPDELVRAEEVLSQLVQANLFLIPLDLEWRWYRFHHLFRDLLLRRLQLVAGQAGLAALQLRAARWLASAGLFEEALRQFLAAGAEDAAADLVERQLYANLGRELGVAPPGYWLRLLPAGLIDRRPGLALIEARLASFNTNVPALEASIARVEALLDVPGTEQSLPWPAFPGDLATLRGSLRYWQGRPSEAINDLQCALELRPIATLASQALHLLGKAFVAAGRYDEGVREIQNGASRVSDTLGALTTATHYLTLCGMQATAGTLAELARDAQHLAEAVAHLGLGDFWICYAEAYRGRAAYERSDLDAAAGHFAAVVQRRYQINAPVYMGCLTGLAQIAIIQGDLNVAAAYEQEVLAFACEVGGAFLRHQALGCSVRLALARGDLPAARVAAQGIAPDIHEGINTWFAVEPPGLSQASVLILSGDSPSLARAEAILAAYLAEVELLHNVQRQIGALAAQALLRQAQGRPADARATLTRAVELAAPRGLVRTLVDRGPALAPLLRALAEQGVCRDYLTGLLAFYAPARGRPAHLSVAHPTPMMPEVLTPREMEILALLAERWSDKEIAARLVIAPNTVRKHTSTLFGKLGVSGRREAVVVAHALGLLPGA